VNFVFESSGDYNITPSEDVVVWFPFLHVLYCQDLFQTPSVAKVVRAACLSGDPFTYVFSRHVWSIVDVNRAFVLSSFYHHPASMKTNSPTYQTKDVLSSIETKN